MHSHQILPHFFFAGEGYGLRDYYAPINIRPHYPLDGQGWGLIGDLTSKIGPRGGAFDFEH